MIPGQCRLPTERAQGARRRRLAPSTPTLQPQRRGHGTAADRNRITDISSAPTSPLATPLAGVDGGATGSIAPPTREENGVAASSSEGPPQNSDVVDLESVDAQLAPATTRERRNAAEARRKRHTTRRC